jgi:hypothetical protein
MGEAGALQFLQRLCEVAGRKEAASPKSEARQLQLKMGAQQLDVAACDADFVSF